MKTSKSVSVGVIAVALLFIGPLGAMIGVLPPIIGFFMFAASAVFGLVALIWGAIVKVRKGARGGALAAVLGLVCLAVAGIPGAMLAGKRGPSINDITTDLTNPPKFIKATQHDPYPADFADKTKKAYPNVKPLELPIAPAAAMELAIGIAKEQDGWTISSSTSEVFEASSETRVFRFVDDFVVRVTPNGGGSRIDMRSASRDGQADFGVNAARIEDYLEKVAKAAKR